MIVICILQSELVTAFTATYSLMAAITVENCSSKSLQCLEYIRLRLVMDVLVYTGSRI